MRRIRWGGRRRSQLRTVQLKVQAAAQLPRQTANQRVACSKLRPLPSCWPCASCWQQCSRCSVQTILPALPRYGDSSVRLAAAAYDLLHVRHMLCQCTRGVSIHPSIAVGIPADSSCFLLPHLELQPRCKTPCLTPDEWQDIRGSVVRMHHRSLAAGSIR